MTFDWNQKKTAWFLQASAWTGFHRHLADLIRPAFSPGETALDLGCGLGLLDLELAGDVKSFTCMDVDAQAVATLRQLVRERGIHNLKARLQDAEALDPDDPANQRDILLLSFYGGEKTSFLRLFRLFRRRAVLIVHGRVDSDTQKKALRQTRKVAADEVGRMLQQAGFPFHLSRHTLEFGQPFGSREEAELYYREYTRDSPDPARRRSFEARLTETGDPVFPLYLKKEKEVGIFCVAPAARPLRNRSLVKIGQGFEVFG